MKKYMFWWHVKDNPVTYPHNDSMSVNAINDQEAINKFWSRIDNEFDYAPTDVDHYEYKAVRS